MQCVQKPGTETYGNRGRLTAFQLMETAFPNKLGKQKRMNMGMEVKQAATGLRLHSCRQGCDDSADARFPGPFHRTKVNACSYAWTDQTIPSGKGHKEVMNTPRAAHTRHTVLRDPALKKGEDRALDLLKVMIKSSESLNDCGDEQSTKCPQYDLRFSTRKKGSAPRRAAPGASDPQVG